MSENNFYTLIAFVLYFLVILGIGIYSFKRSKNVSDYFLGGRKLGPWTTAISAQASDMSGWLLLGLPGSILVSGLTESWIAIGLFIGNGAKHAVRKLIRRRGGGDNRRSFVLCFCHVLLINAYRNSCMSITQISVFLKHIPDGIKGLLIV